MDVMKKQAARFGTEFDFASVERVELEGPIKTLHADGKTFRARTLIVATGATARWLGLPTEENLKGHGVSACATCDGFFFRDQVIVVVGGGDTALEEATFLTKFGSVVHLIHRRDHLRASKAMQDRAFKNPKIKFVWNTVVTHVEGDKKVTGVRLKDIVTGQELTLDCSGLFVAIGHTPNTEIFKGQLAMDENGYLIVESGSSKTNVAGVFAAGDVRYVYRQRHRGGDGLHPATRRRPTSVRWAGIQALRPQRVHSAHETSPQKRNADVPWRSPCARSIGVAVPRCRVARDAPRVAEAWRHRTRGASSAARSTPGRVRIVTAWCGARHHFGVRAPGAVLRPLPRRECLAAWHGRRQDQPGKVRARRFRESA